MAVVWYFVVHVSNMYVSMIDVVCEGDEMNAASSPAVIVVIVIVIIIIIVAIACAVVCYVRRRQGKR